MKTLNTSDIETLRVIGGAAKLAQRHIDRVNQLTKQLNQAITAAHSDGVDTRLLFDRAGQVDQITPRLTTPRLNRAFAALVRGEATQPHRQ